MNPFKQKHIRLTLVRHGQSASNKQKTFTGWNDVPLTEQGRQESVFAGQLLKNRKMTYTRGYTSFLERAVDTYHLIVDELKESSGKNLTNSERNSF